MPSHPSARASITAFVVSMPVSGLKTGMGFIAMSQGHPQVLATGSEAENRTGVS